MYYIPYHDSRVDPAVIDGGRAPRAAVQAKIHARNQIPRDRWQSKRAEPGGTIYHLEPNLSPRPINIEMNL